MNINKIDNEIKYIKGKKYNKFYYDKDINIYNEINNTKLNNKNRFKINKFKFNNKKNKNNLSIDVLPSEEVEEKESNSNILPIKEVEEKENNLSIVLPSEEVEEKESNSNILPSEEVEEKESNSTDVESSDENINTDELNEESIEIQLNYEDRNLNESLQNMTLIELTDMIEDIVKESVMAKRKNILIFSFCKIKKILDSEISKEILIKFVKLYYKKNKNIDNFTSTEINYFINEIFKKIRVDASEFNGYKYYLAKYVGIGLCDNMHEFFAEAYEYYQSKDKKKLLDRINKAKEELESLEIEYIKCFGKDESLCITNLNQTKLNQIKMMDMLGKSETVKENKTFNYVNVYINEKVYQIVKYNKFIFITIEDSIKDCLSEEYILGLFKNFQSRKDYTRVKIGDSNKKSIVLTRRGLLKYLIYLNDSIIKDEKIGTRVTDLIQLSEYLTYSCEV